jgi:hypothetical protein
LTLQEKPKMKSMFGMLSIKPINSVPLKCPSPRTVRRTQNSG